jgi:lysophospholipase L1-like esterase
MKNVLFYSILAISLIAGSLSTSAQSQTIQNNFEEKLQILFVGNSLTYTNNLPQLVRKKLKLSGIKSSTESIAIPDYALSDHWNEGSIQKEIGTGNYDFVIIQQGPSSQMEGRKILEAYGNKIARLCESKGSQLGFFMVWPAMAHYHTFDGVIHNYRDAAKKSKAILFPVGEVWKEHFEQTNNFDYYGPDKFHPSKKGSQTAADVIASILLKNIR